LLEYRPYAIKTLKALLDSEPLTRGSTRTER